MAHTDTRPGEDRIAAIARSFVTTARSPVLGSPADHGLAFEDVTFPAEDGIALSGWFVPSPQPRGIVVVNHPRGFSRTGLPSHRDPWRAQYAAAGNDVEVDFLPDLALLHHAGYHVLAYDLRNHGDSATAHDGSITSGVLESADVVGALDRIRGRADLDGLPIGLFSRCLGANATLFAMRRRPDAFDRVRALVACQPLSPRRLAQRSVAAAGLPAARVDDVDRALTALSGYSFDDRSPVPAASHVRVPTLTYQVRHDVLTTPADVAAVHAAVAAPDKELFWIEDSTRRWDGYLHFQREPDRILRWLDTHLAAEGPVARCRPHPA
ncbi:alpha/beta hydrolase [Pseudonocardia parietis]|uniref:Pimeloyl-ACP methyl ester carboxylesterase n=1 Tax=Pseudonocardia parietis TaxID=570936 RepID=A0ABS4W0R9_9PSEU|nr:hypothetical protein [Pseudonocardia parietis]MBP2369693.1 pimeloyl-ACP methyl ester carboxylesterase [Pseudonocardia parietis]